MSQFYESFRKRDELCKRVIINKENPRNRKKRYYKNVIKFFLAANTSVLKVYLPENIHNISISQPFSPMSSLHLCLYGEV